MNSLIKTPEEISKMRVAGRLTAEVLDMITPYVKAGITTDELDRICYDYIVKTQKATPGCLNYNGFPKSICTSINHQVCHGLPGPKFLKNGDIINIDLTVLKDGYYGDSSRMFLVGEVSILAQRLTRVAKECMEIGIELVKPGIKTGDIGAAIQKHAESYHFSVVREYCGHGIGQKMHEEPQILHFGKPGTGVTIVPGMIFTIEPMVNAGKSQVKLFKDGLTVVTRDHRLSAQWEHTILCTESGYEILTLSK
jgi:methionyl aminopeptidase